MADTIPQNFPIPAQDATANYSFNDIVDGTGVVTFYAAIAGHSGGDEQILVTNPIRSNKIETTFATPATTEFNFDATPFNTPRTAKGTAYFSCAIQAAPSSTGREANVAVQLFKWDGSSETAITSEITSSNATQTTGPIQVLIKLPITQTNFKIGDLLRLSVKFTFVGTAASNAAMGHDPLGRAGTQLSGSDISTIMQIQVPFKLDL